MLKLPKWVGIGGRWVPLHLFLSVFSEYMAKKKKRTPLYMGLLFQPGLSAKVYIKVLEKYCYLLSTLTHTVGGTVSSCKHILDWLQA